MSLRTVGNKDYEIEFTAGDTEYLRLNIKDENGDPIHVGTDYTCIMGIKRKAGDTEFIVPEVMATMYSYDEYTQPYSMEFKYSSADTLAILNYNGKERKKLRCHFDVELTDSTTGDISTVLAGAIDIKRSIGGVV